MPSTTDDFARLSMEYLMDNRDLLSKDGNYLGLWRNPADDRLSGCAVIPLALAMGI